MQPAAARAVPRRRRHRHASPPPSLRSRSPHAPLVLESTGRSGQNSAPSAARDGAFKPPPETEQFKPPPVPSKGIGSVRTGSHHLHSLRPVVAVELERVVGGSRPRRQPDTGAAASPSLVRPCSRVLRPRWKRGAPSPRPCRAAHLLVPIQPARRSILSPSAAGSRAAGASPFLVRRFSDMLLGPLGALHRQPPPSPYYTKPPRPLSINIVRELMYLSSRKKVVEVSN